MSYFVLIVAGVYVQDITSLYKLRLPSVVETGYRQEHTVGPTQQVSSQCMNFVLFS